MQSLYNCINSHIITPIFRRFVAFRCYDTRNDMKAMWNEIIVHIYLILIYIAAMMKLYGG